MLNTFFTSPQSEFEDPKIVFTEQCLALFCHNYSKENILARLRQSGINVWRQRHLVGISF